MSKPKIIRHRNRNITVKTTDAASTLDDADRLEAATLYWASGPMARAALDASQDFPAITAEDCPAATAPATWRPPKAAPLAVDRPLRPRTRGLPRSWSVRPSTCGGDEVPGHRGRPHHRERVAGLCYFPLRGFMSVHIMHPVNVMHIVPGNDMPGSNVVPLRPRRA